MFNLFENNSKYFDHLTTKRYFSYFGKVLTVDTNYFAALD